MLRRKVNITRLGSSDVEFASPADQELGNLTEISTVSREFEARVGRVGIVEGSILGLPEVVQLYFSKDTALPPVDLSPGSEDPVKIVLDPVGASSFIKKGVRLALEAIDEEVTLGELPPLGMGMEF